MRKIEEVLRLSAQGKSARVISRETGTRPFHSRSPMAVTCSVMCRLARSSW